MMTTSDQTNSGEDTRPSHDLADLDIGPVLFVSGMYLILEIGSTLLTSGSATSPFLGRYASAALMIETVVAAIQIGLVVALLAMEHVHPAAAGIRFRAVPKGLLLGLSVWGLSQLTLAIVALGRHGNFGLYHGWVEPAAMIAPILERFLTDVFAEELFWRGIFFVWILRTLERHSWKSPVVRLGAALVGSQLAFAIGRLPAQILGGPALTFPPGATLLVFTMTGMFYALIYLRTSNLWLVMAIHSLTLWPVPLFSFEIDPSKLTVLIAAVLLIPTSSARVAASESEAGNAS